MLVKNPNRPLKLCLALVAGSVISTKLVGLMHDKFGLYLNNMYGMTELGGITTLYRNICVENKYSVGRPLSNVAIKNEQCGICCLR